jgi:murein DD-endopeptidase MepM/ murein hydrolase activator NlpD
MFTHNGDQKYAYDFAMDIGTTVIAARGGTVFRVTDDNPGTSGGAANGVVIDHGDGTYGVYGHLSGGISLTEGSPISQGDTIGQSGNTGYSTGPHLHFHVMKSNNETIPTNFSNASPLHRSPESGTDYTAQP